MTTTNTPTRLSGFCLWPGVDNPKRSHTFCTTKGCECTCHGGHAEGSET